MVSDHKSKHTTHLDNEEKHNDLKQVGVLFDRSNSKYPTHIDYEEQRDDMKQQVGALSDRNNNAYPAHIDNEELHNYRNQEIGVLADRSNSKYPTHIDCEEQRDYPKQQVGVLSDRSNNEHPAHIDNEEQQEDLKQQLGVLSEGIRYLTSILATPLDYTEDEKHIEDLQSKWRLEDTGFSALFNTCKQMQNSLRLTSLEADRDLEELKKVTQILAEAKVEEEKMKNRVFTLQKEKIDLQEKNRILITKAKIHKKQKKVIARIARSIRNVGNAVDEEGNVTSSLADRTINVPRLSNSTSTGSTSSVSSSLVTDEGCATIRFPKEVDKNEDKKKFRIRFPSRVGKNEEKIRLSRKLEKNQEKKFRFRFSRKIFRRMELNILELSFPSKHVGIQFSNVNRNDEEILLVCGFMGFDDAVNRRPEFGSRLIRIDEISLDREGWKMSDFVDYMCDKSGPIRMSFYNEPITTAQIEQLIAIDHALFDS